MESTFSLSRDTAPPLRPLIAVMERLAKFLVRFDISKSNYGAPQTPDELGSKHRIIYYRSRKTNRVMPLRFSNRQQSMEIQQQGSPLSVNDSTAQLTATLSGLGVSQLPLFMAQPYLDSGELQLLLPDWQRAAFPLYLIYPPGRHLSGRLSAFINWVMTVFQPYRPY